MSSAWERVSHKEYGVAVLHAIVGKRLLGLADAWAHDTYLMDMWIFDSEEIVKWCASHVNGREVENQSTILTCGMFQVRKENGERRTRVYDAELNDLVFIYYVYEEIVHVFIF